MFPDRHDPFQFVHDPLTRGEGGPAMPARDANDHGRLCDRDESDPVTQQYFFHIKFLRRTLGDETHLMLGHGAMRLVLNPGDFTTRLARAHRSPENDDRARLRVVLVLRQFERGLGE
ncbi:MAG: hypothetical protein QOK24_577 [Verrucomicrobiota bacterium]